METLGFKELHCREVFGFSLWLPRILDWPLRLKLRQDIKFRNKIVSNSLKKHLKSLSKGSGKEQLGKMEDLLHYQFSLARHCRRNLRPALSLP